MLYNDTYMTTTPKRTFGGKLFGSNRLFFYYNLFFKITREIGERQRRNCGDYSDVLHGSWQTLKLIENLGVKVNISGLDNIPRNDQPVVFVANHMSIAETFLLPCLILPKKKISFIVKQKLLETPFMKDVLEIMNCVGLTRTDPIADLKRMMSEGKKLIQAGKSIVVFPQKTRDTNFHPEEFSSAGIKMAKRFKVPVIPIALKTDFAPNGKLIKELGPIYRNKQVHIEFGEPLEIIGNGKEQHQQCIDFIVDRLKTWKENDQK